MVSGNKSFLTGASMKVNGKMDSWKAKVNWF